MKMICYWYGTDVLTLVSNPPGTVIWHIKLFFYRLKWKMLKGYFEHWAVHKNFIPLLSDFGIKNVRIIYDPPQYGKIAKVQHEGINVLYYRPKPVNLGGYRYINWVYGYDIYRFVKGFFPQVNFIEVDGSQDLSKIYPVTDIYIRPNRFDGMPRMILECQMNDIPYYWKQEMHNYQLWPTKIELTQFINETIQNIQIRLNEAL